MSVNVINYIMSLFQKLKKLWNYRSRQQQIENISGGMGICG